MKAETFFSGEEQKKIEAAIHEVEGRTAGEVAVMVVDRSDSYPEARILAGVLLGSLLALVITDLWFGASLWIFVPAAVVFSLFFGWLVKFLPSVMWLFIPVTRVESQVEERAVRAFYEKGLYMTRDDTGVLFFLSLFEHKVWVLADKGIYSKIPQEKLQEYAADIAKGVKEGQAADVLCREIKNVGDILAEHFPIKPDDTNELSNKIIVE